MKTRGLRTDNEDTTVRLPPGHAVGRLKPGLAGRGAGWVPRVASRVLVTVATGMALWAAVPVGVLAQSVVISEFMADNRVTLADDDGNYSDWIELYNVSDAPVGLGGWYLTDDPANRTKWRFPAVTLASHGFLVVFASGNDRAVAGSPLHTNFKLAAAGEYLGLVQPDGVTIVADFGESYPPQEGDVSFGYPMTGGLWVGGTPVPLVPTPGGPNGSGPIKLAPAVEFSRGGGVFVDGFDLQLSTASSGALIRYVLVRTAAEASATLTNVPTAASPLYAGPIPVQETVQVRARAFEPGKLPGPAVTVTYVQVTREVAEFSSDLPVILIHNFGAGVVPASGNQAGVLASFDSGERNRVTDGPSLMTRVGLTEKAAATAGQPKQGMAVEFWDEYNQDANHPFLGMPPESDWVFHSLGGFDPSLMHNAVFHSLARRTGHYSSRSRYVEVFRKTTSGAVTTNDYYGLYLVLERPRRGPDRIDITRLDAGDKTPEEVTGGYIFRLDRVDANERSFLLPQVPAPGLTNRFYGGQLLVFDDPKGPDLVGNPRRAAQLDYVRRYFTNFIQVLGSPSFADPASGYRAWIDVDEWVDNSIINVLCFNVDAYRLTSYLHKDRGGKLEQGPWWDCDRGLGSGGSGPGTPQTDSRPFNPRVWRAPSVSVGADLGTDFFGFSLVGLNWFDRLFRDPDFWQRWIDRYQELRVGPLATSAVLPLVDGFHDEIREAQARDQLRWSTSFNFPRYGVQFFQGYTNDFGGTNRAMPRGGYFTNEVNFLKRWLADRMDFMDTNFLARPTLGRAPGLVVGGSVVRVDPAAEPGTLLLYTLDGTDPRAPGGAVAPLARTNSGPMDLVVANNIRLFARSYNPQHANLTSSVDGLPQVGNPPSNSFWSGPVVGSYYVEVPAVRVTEIHYHPAPPPGGSPGAAADFEFVEIKNAGSTPLDLAGFHLAGGVSATLSSTVLPPGEYGVIVRNLAAFRSRYGDAPLVVGQFAGPLPDGGGVLALAGPLEEPVQELRYDPGWVLASDGYGFSLVARDEASPSPPQSASFWRASAEIGGSPGRADPAPPDLPRVVVNEVLAFPVPPDQPAIELLNLSSEPANLSGWYLTDDLAAPRKFRLADGTVLAPGGFLAVLGGMFDDPSLPPSQRLSLGPQGGQVYLISATADGTFTGYVHGFAFGPSDPGVSLGRLTISTGEERLVAQSAASLSAPNAGPRLGLVVISEIHYHPAHFVANGRCVENVADEFVELRNSSGAPVQLQAEGTNWRLQGPIQFAFPPGASLAPFGFLVVVPFSPANDPDRLNRMRSRFGLPTNVPVFGPWTGALPDDGGRLELARSVAGSPPGVFGGLFAVVDGVSYQSVPPWPGAANGTPFSLQRLELSQFGDDPGQWTTGPPTPGRPFLSGPAPVIGLQPADATEPASGRASFRATVSGPGGLRYVWRFNGCLLREATNSSLELINIQPAQAGLYELLAFNDAGVAISRAARLTVVAPVLVTVPPRSQRVREGAPVTLSVAASTARPPLAYQWLRGGVPIPGATSSNLVFPAVQEADAGVYAVALTDGNGVSYSPEALLTVLVPPGILAPDPPLQLTAVEGSRVTFSVRTRGTVPMLYRWRHIPLVGIPKLRSEVVLDANECFFSIPQVQTNDAGVYTLILTNEIFTSVGVQRTNAVLTVVADSDHDGLADDWEQEHFGSATAADPDADPDHDGVSNRDEYVAGTDPNEAGSYLRVDRVSYAGTVRLEFRAAANRTYSVQHRDGTEGGWSRLSDVVASGQARVIELTDPRPASASGVRLYRLVTPQGP